MRKNILLLIIFLFSALYVSAQNIPITEGALDASASRDKMPGETVNVVELQISATIEAQRVVLENPVKPENIPPGNSENSAAVLNEILKRMEAHRKNLKSLRADIKMTNYDSQLNDSEIFEGAAVYLRRMTNDSMVKIDLAKPRKEIFAVIKDNYVVYIPHLQLAVTGNTDGKIRDPLAFLDFSRGKFQNPLAFLNFSREKLKTNFKITYPGEEKLSDQTPVWRLELTPKVGSLYKSVVLWIDVNGMPVQVKLLEKNDNYSIIQLSNLRKNTVVKTSEGRVILPKETKVVKN